jgi:hypothetical protein
MTDPTPHLAAPLPRRPWQRAAMVFAVLLGFFLMHGMPAVGGTGCHGVMPASLTARAMDSGMSAPAMAATPGPGMAVSSSTATVHGTGSSALVGDSCTPLRPDGPGGLLLALGACALWMSWRRPGGANRIAGALRGWAHGPPRSGIDLLCALGVCRT